MHSHSNAPALALRAIGMHPKYAGYGYSLAILRITHRHPEYIYRLPKMVYPRIMELFGCTRSALDRYGFASTALHARGQIRKAPNNHELLLMT